MTNKGIAVCCVGNPTASSTWSGTPANICRLLGEMGRLSATLNSSESAHPRVRQVANVVSKLYYGGGFDAFARGRFQRYLCGRYVNTFFRTGNSTDVLHTGTLDLPLPKISAGIRHHLFCDTTWDLWRRGSSTIVRYNEKFLDDAERLEYESYHQMSHIFPISEYVRQNLMDHYHIPPERITVVGTGRGAIKPFTGAKDYENCTVLFVAKERFEDKGGTLLVEGFKRASAKNPRLRLVILGDERYRDAIGQVPNIEIHGFVSLERLQDFFNRASLFAMPAKNEPWGLVYLEALSCKTPVMGFNRNALPEITQYGRFGFCLNEATAESVAEGLLDACSDPQRLARMGSEGQDYCLQNFTWERTVKRIVETIDGCDVPLSSEARNQSRMALCER